MRIVQVDSFTDVPFSGNPAAVCVLPQAADESWMQHVAREMNLSETAFLVQRDENDYDLRWFTPTVEVDLCGHATLASAHVLWSEGHASGDLRFQTRAGELGARRDGDWIELDFPAQQMSEAEIPDGIAEAVGGEPVLTAKGIVGGGFEGYLIEYATEEEVRSLKPDFSALLAIPDAYPMVTAPASMPGYDFVSRFFAPHAGINEDPVTGSSFCALAPWWSNRLGRDELLAFQCSARGGTVRTRVDGDRVRIAGQAVTVMEGELIS